jgi:predicted HicB family RNase H-like nuclease
MNKLKTLRISEETHTQLKIFCAKNKLKLNEWVDKLIKHKLQKYEK